MEFTKNQKDFIEYFKNNNITFKGKDINEIFPEVSKPERKKIRVEIEYQAQWDLNPDKIRDCMESDSCYYDKDFLNFKVTELPEVFSRSDVIDFLDFYENSKFEGKSYDYETAFKIWLSERNSK